MRKKIFSRLKNFIKIAKVLGGKRKGTRKSLKSIETEMKSSLEGFKGRFEQTDKRISELEDRTIEIIEEQKEKTLKKSEQNLKDTIKKSRYILWGVSEGKERQKRQKDYLKKQWSNTSQFDERA